MNSNLCTVVYAWLEVLYSILHTVVLYVRICTVPSVRTTYFSTWSKKTTKLVKIFVAQGHPPEMRCRQMQMTRRLKLLSVLFVRSSHVSLIHQSSHLFSSVPYMYMSVDHLATVYNRSYQQQQQQRTGEKKQRNQIARRDRSVLPPRPVTKVATCRSRSAAIRSARVVVQKIRADPSRELRSQTKRARREITGRSLSPPFAE